MPFDAPLLLGMLGAAAGVLAQASLSRRALGHLDDHHRLQMVDLARTRSKGWTLATVALLPLGFVLPRYALFAFTTLVLASGASSVRRYRAAGFPDAFLRVATQNYVALAAGFGLLAAAILLRLSA